MQRIFYFHVNSAWAAFLGFFVAAGASAMFLWRGHAEYDRLADAAVEVGMVFCTMVLVTGPIWARPIWGAWWTWDPRLTMTVILWTIYAVYLVLRSVGRDDPQIARYAAVLARDRRARHSAHPDLGAPVARHASLRDLGARRRRVVSRIRAWWSGCWSRWSPSRCCSAGCSGCATRDCGWHDALQRVEDRMGEVRAMSRPERFWFLFAAYGAFWVLLGVVPDPLGRRHRELEREIRALETRLPRPPSP